VHTCHEAVIPAGAGIQAVTASASARLSSGSWNLRASACGGRSRWIPAFAGMTQWALLRCGPGSGPSPGWRL